jgi:hypothetical protein
MHVFKKCCYPAVILLLLTLVALDYYLAITGLGFYPWSWNSSPAPFIGPSATPTIALAVTPKASGGKLEVPALARALQPLSIVDTPRLDGDDRVILAVMVVRPVKFSELSEQLRGRGATVDEEHSRLCGRLRLHVSGAT